ncbi:MAG: hypothetical protein KatS3mg050_3401 [Litorilinea sp.]|nr:MAG: hypothetical protein KatS3mg050_3401 [Litorilinea sp.]
MPYLLAAEADKIQDFIFRSSRLREVVGASQLLTRFCRSVEETLAKDYNAQVVVNDGGSFRVIFETKDQAVAFRRRPGRALPAGAGRQPDGGGAGGAERRLPQGERRGQQEAALGEEPPPGRGGRAAYAICGVLCLLRSRSG